MDRARGCVSRWIEYSLRSHTKVRRGAVLGLALLATATLSIVAFAQQPATKKPAVKTNAKPGAKPSSPFDSITDSKPDAKPATTPEFPPRTFKAPAGFRVENVLGHAETGSLIAMAFDENGNILASREGGPLLRIQRNATGKYEAGTYCDHVKNCQGILVRAGRAFVNAEGPEGLGLYQLVDGDGDGAIGKEEVKLLVGFTASVLEHGPHGLAVGPDGWLYIAAGNYTKLVKPAADSSPYHHSYDDDLVQPRFEDPNGVGSGIKAPGGTILRVSPDGKTVETVAGGMRNTYDLAFSGSGELFTHDADMELDLGAPWYRPTRVLHVTAGAEFGWRSGWAKWPEYYVDSLPPALNTGTGSPAGMEFYNHTAFPESYRNVMFVCDWAKGQIVVVRFQHAGGSYKATSEVFLQGDPLSGTDVTVGPDGALYFCAGGRGTEGGIYRVTWTGRLPKIPPVADDTVEAAMVQPQPQSAWGQARLAALREKLADAWGPGLIAVAQDARRTTPDRLRALDLLHQSDVKELSDLLPRLALDGDVAIRGKTAYLLGLRPATEVDDADGATLAKLINDADPFVRRLAMEAEVRRGQKSNVDTLFKNLASEDRHVAWAAQRALQRRPLDDWRDRAVAAAETRTFVTGSAALLAIDDDEATARLILARSRKIMQGFVSDRDFVDLLRVQQLAVLKAKLTSVQMQSFGAQLAEEFPSKSPVINREVIRLLVHLQASGAAPRMIQQLESSASPAEKTYLAMHLSRLNVGWTSAQKMTLLRYFEQARTQSGGASLGRYLERAALDFGKQLSTAEQGMVLRDALRWPTAATAVLAQLPKEPGANVLRLLEDLDRRTAGQQPDAVARMKIAIVAVMGRSGDPQATAYLRGVHAADPDRRVAVAMALSQDPGGENWAVLVQSLPLLDGAAAQEVLKKLATVDQQPKEAEAFRQVILRGLKLKEHGAPLAIKLLEKWSGDSVSTPEQKWDEALAAWQSWFREKYPDQPAPTLPVDSDDNKWNFDQLLTYLDGPEAKQAQASRGAAVFTTAQCNRCHRYGNQGDAVGPDLTTVSKRFRKREILESILFPSHVISDQYASKSVLTNDGRALSGLVSQAGTSVTVLLPTGEKVTLAKDEIDEIKPSNVSVMPEGLLNNLSAPQIADLFAYLSQPPAATVNRPGVFKRPAR